MLSDFECGVLLNFDRSCCYDDHDGASNHQCHIQAKKVIQTKQTEDHTEFEGRNRAENTSLCPQPSASHTTKLSPLRVFALQLVELSGNTTSLFNQQRSGGAQALTKAQEDLESITNIFQTYTGANENTSVETFAAASTYSNIHEDIYNVSQEKQASLMRDAPCSVGIIVDRGLGSLFKVNLRVLVLFIGGPDDREALAVAWRMSKHQGVQLSVMRILMYGEAAEVDVLSHVESRGLLSVVLRQ